jgi:hypothetical protein
MPWQDAIGYAGAILVLVQTAMRTMIPLRALGMVCNAIMLCYGASRGSMPSILLQGILLPINAWRLREMVILTRRVRAAASGDLNMEWLKPFMSRRSWRAGEVVFRKDDVAGAMYYTVRGGFRLTEIDVPVLPGRVVGELGMLSPERRRTKTLECTQDGELLEISYSQVQQLYFQNPQFGFLFLRLAGERLFDELRRAEARQTEPAEISTA